METNPVSNSDEQLLAILAMLDKCRSALASGGNSDAAHLVSVAALDIKMKLNGIGDDELRLLCDAMMAVEHGGDTPREVAREDRSLPVPEPRHLLRVVK